MLNIFLNFKILKTKKQKKPKTKKPSFLFWKIMVFPSLILIDSCNNNRLTWHYILIVSTTATVANWLRLVLLQTIQNNLGNHAHCINAHGIHARLLQDIVHRLKIKNLFTPANYRGRQLSSILAMYSRVTKCLSAFPPPRGEGLIWSAHRLYLYAPLLSN